MYQCVCSKSEAPWGHIQNENCICQPEYEDRESSPDEELVGPFAHEHRLVVYEKPITCGCMDGEAYTNLREITLILEFGHILRKRGHGDSLKKLANMSVMKK